MPARTAPPKSTPGVERGCGYREEGGLYLECGTSSDGMPVEHFWADPPIPYNPAAKRGQIAIRRGGALHIVDWIGQKHYPSPADFLEEVRRFGMSRRIGKRFLQRHGSEITEATRVLCVHANAVCHDLTAASATEVLHSLLDEDAYRRLCAHYRTTGETDHLDDPETPCTRHWYLAADGEADNGAIRAVRERPSFAYTTFGGSGGEDLRMDPGIIASFPVSRISVIRADDGSHEHAHDIAQRSAPNVHVGVEEA